MSGQFRRLTRLFLRVTLWSEGGREMKKRWRFAAAAVLTLVLFAVSGTLLLKCMKPMEDRAYDLSLVWAGEAMPEGWVYDQKGWTVFTQEGETVTELTKIRSERIRRIRRWCSFAQEISGVRKWVLIFETISSFSYDWYSR